MQLIKDPLLSIIMLVVASWIFFYNLANVYSEIRGLRRVESAQHKSSALAGSSIVDKH
jgi:hypothetical protein